MSDKKTAIVWLRRDLRLDDHFAFDTAANNNLEIIPIFIFDKKILANFKLKDDRRVNFLVDRLNYLNNVIKKRNGKILTYFGNPEEIISCLIAEFHPSHLIAGAGYEKYDIERDEKISTLCKNKDVEFICENDHLIFEPTKIKKSDGSIYQVFTPFSRTLYKEIKSEYITQYKTENLNFRELSNSEIDNKFLLNKNGDITIEQIGYKKNLYSPWKCEFSNKDVDNFKKKISSYKIDRDFLALDGTSMFSPYLRFGFISIRKCLNLALDHSNGFAWLNELMWREFYAVVLFHFPNFENEECMAKYRTLKWRNDSKLVEAFENGQTGYPIVDAAMRQLKEIGWVHNRARMIIASFLTKHLQIDWRIGEKIYANYLMDYELASNVGGWQWAASTGFDAQPYFRVFNPYLQSKKFDSDGKYIKKYVPELKDVPAKNLHAPIDGYKTYPKPIVKHEEARIKAIKLFKST